jgi:hypothetical protein
MAMSAAQEPHPDPERRRLLAAVAGLALGGWPAWTVAARAPQDVRNADRPETFEGPPAGAGPGEFSRIENLFWLPRMAEHALFFSRLMPGQELARERQAADDFHRKFRLLHAKAGHLRFERDSHLGFNREVVEAVKGLVEWKYRMREAQASGAMQSLVWPSFFDEAAREGVRFIARLQQFGRGETQLDRAEVIRFWAQDVAGHLDMLAHLLDPHERRRILECLKQAEEWQVLGAAALSAGSARPAGPDPVQAAGAAVLELKTALEQDVLEARVHSILQPRLLEHMRLETLRFLDELKRAR